MTASPHRGVCGKGGNPIESIDHAESDGLRGAAARGLMWTFTQAWGARLMSIAVFAVLGRRLDASEFGVMALALAIVEFGRLLVDQGLSRSIVQRTTIDEEHLDTAFWTAIAGGALLTVIGVALSGPLAAAFDEPQLAPVLRVLSVTFLLTALTTTQVAVLQRDLRFRGLAFRRLISVAGGGIAGVALAVGGAGVWALVAQNLTQAVVAVAALWTVSPWRPGRRVSMSRFREMARFGMPALAIELVSYFARRGDDLLIGAFLGPVALGFFNVAYRMFTIVIEVFTSTINSVAFPVFSRLQHDRGRMRRALHGATRLSSAVAFPAFIGLAVLAPEVTRAMFGDRWGESADVLRILALAGVVRSVAYFNRSLLLAVGKPEWDLAWVTMIAVTKVPAFAIGYHWGIEGIAWAIVAHDYAIAPAGVWLINKATPIDPRRYVGQFVAPLLSSLAMAAAVLPLSTALSGEVADAAIIAVGAVLGLGIYTVVLYLLAPATVRELMSHAPPIGPLRRLRRAEA